MKVSVDLPAIVGNRLMDASEKTGISKNDLTRIFVASGLDQLEGPGVVIRDSESSSSSATQTQQEGE